nr:hypothetical protein [Nostoc sp. ChiSLP01]
MWGVWGVWGVWGERELMLPHPPTPLTPPTLLLAPCPMPNAPTDCRQHAQKPSILERSLKLMRRELLLSH